MHDNAVLHAAHTALQSDVTHLMPLYVFDERSIELSGLPGYKREGKEARTRLCGYWRTGAFRARCVELPRAPWLVADGDESKRARSRISIGWRDARLTRR